MLTGSLILASDFETDGVDLLTLAAVSPADHALHQLQISKETWKMMLALNRDGGLLASLVMPEKPGGGEAIDCGGTGERVVFASSNPTCRDRDRAGVGYVFSLIVFDEKTEESGCGSYVVWSKTESQVHRVHD